MRFNSARAHVRNLVDDIIRARTVSAATEEDTKGYDDSHADWLSTMLKDPSFADPILIRDTLVALVFAGRDNTQNSFAWSLNALMSSPQWISRMRLEAKENRKPGRELDYGDLSVRYLL